MNPSATKTDINTDECVRERYSAASKSQEPALCCPVVYDTQYLEVIPQAILDRDYGCGDPSPYVRPGDTVVDLGSGGGKLCYIMSQMVGEEGKVIGVDFNPDMLELARGHQDEVAKKIGYSNIDFKCGRIQDLAVDLEQISSQVKSLAGEGVEGTYKIMSLAEEIRSTSPMIPDNSVDCVVSNCVLNLVRPADRIKLFQEIFRVLKPGGRAAISDIVSDEQVTIEMQNDSDLWSGCISGAWREDHFVEEFVKSGFQGVQIDKRGNEPWQTVNGIEFRSVTVLAFKPFGDACLEKNQAVIYKGPFSEVRDDDGHTYYRGVPMAVCEKTFQILSEQGISDSFYLVPPRNEISSDSAQLFDCSNDRRRDPKETKGAQFNLTQISDGDCCSPGDSCC